MSNFNAFAKKGCPCSRECQERTSDCHATCEKYKTWKLIEGINYIEMSRHHKGAAEAKSFEIECTKKRKRDKRLRRK